MISERDTLDASFPTPINPRLKEVGRVRPDRMPLWVSVIITIATHNGHQKQQKFRSNSGTSAAIARIDDKCMAFVIDTGWLDNWRILKHKSVANRRQTNQMAEATA
jgi:hypothetical protein